MTLSSAQTNNISEMTTKEKVAQMFMVQGDKFHQEYLDLGIGGYFLNSQNSKENYSNPIKQYNNSKIKPFFATDLEGYWNTLNSFYESKSFGEVRNKTEAYELGVSHAKILKEIGFNWDFSPVVETKNTVWINRSFTGNNSEINDKISSYIKGLEENDIMATAKHYPGGNLLKNPHFFKVKVSAENLELDKFSAAINANVSSIMVGHTIVNKKQSTVDKQIISELKEKFDGIIITDAITMLGLKISYIFRQKKMIEDLILAGSDVILYTSVKPFGPTPKKVTKYINYISEEIEKGKIDINQIDKSVEKILKYKGYEVVN